MYSCIDDGAAFAARIRLGPCPASASLHRGDISKLHDRNYVDISSTTKIGNWVQEVDAAGADGLPSPVQANDNPSPTSTPTPKDSLKQTPGLEAGSDIFSYIDDGAGFPGPGQKAPAMQASRRRGNSAPPLGQSSHNPIRIPEVETIVPQATKRQSTGARPGNVSNAHYPDVEKAAWQDIRSTLKNMESLAAAIGLPKSAGPVQAIRVIPPPALPTFIIKAKGRNAPVIVDGRGEPIGERPPSPSRKASGGHRRAADEGVGMPEYPVFTNKVYPVPRAAKPNSGEQKDADDTGLDGWDVDMDNKEGPGQDNNQRNQKKGKKQQQQENQKKQGNKARKASPKAVDGKKDGDGDDWDGLFENLVVSPTVSPTPSNADVWMSGERRAPSPPGSVPGEESRKDKPAENSKGKGKGKPNAKQTENVGQGKKGKKGQQDKESNEKRLETILEAVENDDKDRSGDNNRRWNNTGAVNMQNGNAAVQWPAYPQQQPGVTFALPALNTPPPAVQYLAAPLQMVTPHQALNMSPPNPDAGPQGPGQSNYKPPTVESVSSSPDKGKKTLIPATEGSPRTPGGRRKNGYDDDEGYTNQVWGGIPVRVAEWKLQLP
jgi:hypothetical protein